MTRRAQMLFMVVLAACTKQPTQHSVSRSPAANDEAPVVPVPPAGDTGGIVTGVVAPSAVSAQRLSASPTSAVAAASVTFRPGTLVAGGTVTIEEGTAVVSDQLLTLLAGVDASVVTSSAAAVKIDIDPPADPAAPIEISIPAPAAAGLQSTPGALAVFYHAVRHGAAQQSYSGVLFAESLTLEDGVVRFEFASYGAFQAVYLSEPEALRGAVTSARQVATPPLGKAAEGALAAFSWGVVEAQRSGRRGVVVSFTGQSGKVSDCALQVDDDQERPFLASAYFGAKTFATLTVPGESASVFARIACFDAAGRAVASPWSTEIALDAAAASPTPSPSSAPSSSPASSPSSPEVLSDATPPVPGALGALTAENPTAFSARLSWTKGEDDVSPSAKLVYRVYRSTSDNIATLADLEKNGTAIGTPLVDLATATAGGLSEATTYWLNVVVRDEAGNAAVYTPTKITTIDASPPVPGNGGLLAVGATTTSQVALTWTAASDGVTPAASLRYRLYYSTTNNIGSVATLKANGTAVGSDLETALTEKTVTGLSESTSYYFNVLVTDAAGNETVYMPMSARTLDGTAPVPGASGTLTTGTVTGSSIEVRWTAASDNAGVAGISYALYRSSSNNLDTVSNILANGTLIGTAFTTGTSRTATGLSELGTYYFNVIVKDATGNKAAYAQTSFKTVDVTVPTPGNSGAITSSSITGTTATLSWTAATDNGTSSSSLLYTVYKAADAASSFDTVATVKAGEACGTADQANTTSLLITGLSSSTTYKFNVLVKDARGNQTVYKPLSVTTADTTPPVVTVDALTAVSYTAKSLTLQWSAASDAVTTNPALLTYRAHHSTSALTSLTDVINASSSMAAPEAGITTKQLTGLTPGTTYYFNVVVRDEAGNAEKYATLQQALPSVIGNSVEPATPTLTHVKTVAGTGTAGSVDNAIGTLATIEGIKAMTTDGVDVFFAQTDGKIRKLSSSTGSVTTIATGVTSPQGLTSDGTFLYVSTGHAIKRIRLSDGTSVVVAGSESTSGYADAAGASARFNTPRALAADGAYLYVWDHANALIRKMQLTDPYTVGTLAGVASTAGVDDTAGTLQNVTGMTLAKDVSGTLYVAEAAHCIRQIAAGAVVTKIGNCTDIAAKLDDAGTAARFNTPSSLVSTGSAIYVADAGNHAIRAVSNLTAGHDVTTASGTGSSGSAANAAVGSATWNTPTAMTSTIDGIYVYDSLNHVIRRIGPP